MKDKIQLSVKEIIKHPKGRMFLENYKGGRETAILNMIMYCVDDNGFLQIGNIKTSNEIITTNEQTNTQAPDVSTKAPDIPTKEPEKATIVEVTTPVKEPDKTTVVEPEKEKVNIEESSPIKKEEESVETPDNSTNNVDESEETNSNLMEDNKEPYDDGSGLPDKEDITEDDMKYCM